MADHRRVRVREDGRGGDALIDFGASDGWGVGRLGGRVGTYGRPFAVLLAATGLADSGGGLFATSATLLAATTTGDPGAVAAVAAASSLPWLLTGVPVGVVVDALDRRRLMAAANAGRAAVMVGLGVVVATGPPPLGVLLVAAFVVGVLQVAVDTCAEAAVPDLVDPAARTGANGALTVATRVAHQFSGPVLAGVLHAVAASVPPLTAGAMCGLAAVVLLVTPGTPRAAAPAVRARPSLLAGLADIARDPVLRTLAVVSGATTFANAAFLTALVLHVVSPGPLGRTAAEYGVAVGAIGLGATAGSLLTAWLEARLGRHRVLWLSRVGWAAVFAAPLTGSYPLLVVLAASGSVLGGTWAVLALSVRQTVVPRHHLGRVGGAYRTLTHGCTPLGAAAAGGAVSLWGPSVVFAITTAAMLVLIVPLRRPMTEHRDSGGSARTLG